MCHICSLFLPNGKFSCILQKFRDDVSKAFGGPTGGYKLLKEKTFENMTNSRLLENMKTFCGKEIPSSLKEYSHWLANFHINCCEGNLEIPGSYNGISLLPNNRLA